MRAKLDALTETFRDFREETREWRKLLVERLDTQSRRIGALERWRAWVMGGIGLALALWTAVIGWVGTHR